MRTDRWPSAHPAGVSAPRSRRLRGEHGSGTVLVASVVLLLMVMTGCLLTIAGYIAVSHHARSAADLVALSGASGLARGRDACQSVHATARDNGTRVVACRTRGDSLDFVVTVTVAQAIAAPVPFLPGEVEATASAGRLGLLR